MSDSIGLPTGSNDEGDEIFPIAQFTCHVYRRNLSNLNNLPKSCYGCYEYQNQEISFQNFDKL
jgi:hypothetical protein